MNREMACGEWLCEYDDKLIMSVKVERNGDIIIRGKKEDGGKIAIKGVNVREAFWLAEVMQQAAEMSQKRPLDAPLED